MEEYTQKLIEIHKELCDMGIGHEFRVSEPDIFPELMLTFQPQGKKMNQCAGQITGLNAKL